MYMVNIKQTTIFKSYLKKKNVLTLCLYMYVYSVCFMCNYKSNIAYCVCHVCELRVMRVHGV